MRVGLPLSWSLEKGRPSWSTSRNGPPIDGLPPCVASQAIHPAAMARAAIQTPISAFMVRDMARNMGRQGRLDKPDRSSHKLM